VIRFMSGEKERDNRLCVLLLPVLRLAWAASTGNLNNINSSNEFPFLIHKTNLNEQRNPDSNDDLVCKGALQVLTIALVLNPSA